MYCRSYCIAYRLCVFQVFIIITVLHLHSITVFRKPEYFSCVMGGGGGGGGWKTRNMVGWPLPGFCVLGQNFVTVWLVSVMQSCNLAQNKYETMPVTMPLATGRVVFVFPWECFYGEKRICKINVENCSKCFYQKYQKHNFSWEPKLSWALINKVPPENWLNFVLKLTWQVISLVYHISRLLGTISWFGYQQYWMRLAALCQHNYVGIVLTI